MLFTMSKKVKVMPESQHARTEIIGDGSRKVEAVGIEGEGRNGEKKIG